MYCKNMLFRLVPGVLLMMSLVVTGCSDKAIVSGMVTYSDNGEPVQSGMVVFIGDKEQGRGLITNGRYSIGLLKDGDGIPPGTYTVSADQASSAMGSAMSVAATVYMDGSSAPATEVPPMESYYTKEPQSLEVKKSMTYDFTVERGTRPIPQR